MSQPIDTDTFVSAELDLGIDLVSLEPIEEEDADYLDSVETIDKFDSKDSMGNTNISNVPANPGERQDAIYNSSRSLVREASENKIRFDDTEDERRQEDIKSDSSRGQDSSDSQIDESDAITVEVNNSSGSAIGLDRAIIGTKEASESEPTNDSVTNVVDTPIHGEGSLSAGVEGSPAAGEDAEEDADDLDKAPEVDAGEESYAAEVQVEDDTIASADELEEDDDEGPDLESVEAVVEEDANAAEFDNIDEDEMQEVDAGEESYAAEVQVEDDTIASPDEVPEAEDEGAEAEAAEGAAIEEESNAAELDDIGQVEMQEVDAGEESYAEVQVEDDIIASPDEFQEAEDEGAEAENEAAEGAAVEEDANVLTGAAVGLFAESSRDNTEEEDRNGAKVDDEDEGIPDAGGDVEMDVNCLKDEVPEDSVAGNSNAEDVQVEDRNIATIDDIIRDKDEETDADSVEVSLQDSLASKLDCIGEDNAAAGEEEMQDESVAGMSAKEDVQVEDDNIASTDEPEVNEDEGPDPESVEPSVEDDAIAPEVDDDVEQFFAAVEVLEDEEDDKIDVDADVENGNEISGIDMSTAEIDEQELINVESIDLRNESDDGSDSDVSPLGMKSHDEKNQVSFTLDVDISEVAHNGPESKDFIEGAMPSIPQDAILQSDDKQFDALLDDGGIDGDNSPLLDGDNAADVESESALFQGSIPEPEAEHTKIATKFSDAPKTTSLSSAKSRALRNDDQWKSSQTLSTSRISSRSMSRPRTSSTSMSRPSSSGRSSIHTQLYERSIPQQEEGKKRRHEVEDSLRRRSDERNGKYCDQVYHQREKNDSKRESLKEEFSKPKKISISDAEDLYQRLLSYKIKTDERRIQLRKDRDAREMEWLNNTSKNKISPQEACGIYYRGTVSSRSRSRGRE